MRIAITLAFAPLVCACSVVPPQAWSFDPTVAQTRAPIRQEANPLPPRIAELRAQREEIRRRIAASQDAWTRQLQYDQLHSLGMELARLEREPGLYITTR